ncbi:MAG: peptidase M28, partial [Flavobacteriales bacterium]
MRLSSLLFFLIFTLSCSTNSVYKNNIIFDVEYLSSDELEGRSTGSKGEELAANYIEKRFKELNVEPIGENGYFQEFSFKQKSHPHDTISTSDSIQENSITGKNVIGFIDNKSINTIV